MIILQTRQIGKCLQETVFGKQLKVRGQVPGTEKSADVVTRLKIPNITFAGANQIQIHICFWNAEMRDPCHRKRTAAHNSIARKPCPTCLNRQTSYTKTKTQNGAGHSRISDFER